ncbi:nuclear transport factor 2 family protein [Geodermatophilus marinus]|uniref:nuclear transport factor 2 family protein n=1 Tax=Geodermatophilus sp. LHW52908 TaxID=2303986 RepID=UPI0018F627C6|nr:nuclear transport factor 2 family protein [Geodermatophilus sp. LHW52908]
MSRLDLPAVTADLTTVAGLPEGDLGALARAVRAQADRQAIADLGVLYARAVDDHDVDSVVAMYTADGVFERRGVAATGRAEIRAAYVASFDTYRTMLHTPHPGVVQLHGDGTASGWSHGHAELATRSTLVLASFRYEDDYRRVDGRWLFAKRSITFMYAVPADELATSFGSVERMRWPRTAPEPADYPESAPTWETYRA